MSSRARRFIARNISKPGSDIFLVHFSPNYADFNRNFPAGKVVDTNHRNRGHKPSRHVEMFATKSVTSLRQSPRTLSRTKIMKVDDMIYVADFHDLRRRRRA